MACAAIDLEDWDGATNRAYYAMFNAARMALREANPSLKQDFAKTHHGLILMFNNHLVKNDRFPQEIGHSLNRAFEMRLMADYKDDSVEETDARKIVGEAKIFIDAIKTKYFPDVELEKQNFSSDSVSRPKF